MQSGGNRRVTHRELAEVCGVSTATVSRALSGHPRVREAVRERIVREAERLGYRPDPRLAYLSRLRWSSGRKADTVKILVLVDRFTGADLQDPKFRELERAAEGLGYGIEYAFCGESPGTGGTPLAAIHDTGNPRRVGQPARFECVARLELG